MPADHDEIGTPAWEARVLRRQAEVDTVNAESLRRRADELDPPDQVSDLATWLGVDRAEAADKIRETISGPAEPVMFMGPPPDLLRDAVAYLATAHDTKAAALIDGLAAEVQRLRVTATAEPGTTDQREATAEWLQRLDIDDTVGTDTVAVFSLLRDVADHEPLTELIDAAGSGETVGMHCVVCKAEALGEPVDHRLWCPWVRTTQIVGTATDGG